MDRGGGAASARRTLALPLRVLPSEAHAARLQVGVSLCLCSAMIPPLLWKWNSRCLLWLCSAWFGCVQWNGELPNAFVQSRQCWGAGAGAPSRSAQISVQGKALLLFHSSFEFSSYSYLLHCYVARTKLRNVELVQLALDTPSYAFSPENENFTHYIFTLINLCMPGTLWDASCIRSLSIDGMS